MTTPTALVLVVFGRGVLETGGRYALTPGSIARVEAAAYYVATHEAAFRAGPARIIFTGGWAEAAEGAPRPPSGDREGDLMLRWAREAALDAYADLMAETGSRSTLENLVRLAQDGLLAGYRFDAAHPLGVVSDAWHLPRVRFLAGKVLGLRGGAVLDVPVTGGERAAGRIAPALHLASRLGFLGTRDPAALLRRERRLVAVMHRFRAQRGKPPPMSPPGSAR
jgi:uncharacterized SAM-binding protein YcdF (DUF218 family)